MLSHNTYIFTFFFFSSRRRHTRLTCDWSSDVCSSDLPRRLNRRRPGWGGPVQPPGGGGAGERGPMKGEARPWQPPPTIGGNFLLPTCRPPPGDDRMAPPLTTLLGRARAAAPTALVLAALAGLAWWGYATDWAVPRFGGPAAAAGEEAEGAVQVLRPEGAGPAGAGAGFPRVRGPLPSAAAGGPARGAGEG